MSLKVKLQPEKIYESVTYQFTLEDSEGNEYRIRKWEDTNGGGYYIYKDGTWIDYQPNDEFLDFIDYDMNF